MQISRFYCADVRDIEIDCSDQKKKYGQGRIELSSNISCVRVSRLTHLICSLHVILPSHAPIHVISHENDGLRGFLLPLYLSLNAPRSNCKNTSVKNKNKKRLENK